MNQVRPPKLAESLLRWLTPNRVGQALLGDLAEGFAEILNESGPTVARRWYWAEVLQSIPSLSMYKLRHPQPWRQIVNGPHLIPAGRKYALWSLLFLLPALLLVSSGLMFTLFGVPGLVDRLAQFLGSGLPTAPGVVLGGMGIALLINLLAVLKVSSSASDEMIHSNIAIKKSNWNLLILGLAAFLGLIIFLYLVVENFGPLF